MEPITIPAEVTLEKIPGVIIDFSSREQTEQDLLREIEKSNVICLVYAQNDAQSKEKLKSFYLPKIREVEEAPNVAPLDPLSSSNSFAAKLEALSADSSAVPDTNLVKLNHINSLISLGSKQTQTRRPIVIVANKSDLLPGAHSPISDPLIKELVIAHTQIETCVECSAKTLKNVPEVFYYAQKSVLYPTEPIYDVELRQLTPLAMKCLTRIFKLCDADNDGRLSDGELNEFQLTCFGMRLNGATLQEVKTILRGNNGSVNYLSEENEVTLAGFLRLNELFVNKGRHETFWTVLKKFGYDKNLSLSRDYAHPR